MTPTPPTDRHAPTLLGTVSATDRVPPGGGAAISLPPDLHHTCAARTLDTDSISAADPDNATYHGWPRPDGQITVVVEFPSGIHRPLPHLVRHSPGGFNWGYDGNGPRDLARSLITDALSQRAACHACAGPVPHPNDRRAPHNAIEPTGAPADACPTPICPKRCDAELQPLPYLRFTEQIIAVHLHIGTAWSLPRSEVLRWLSSQHGGQNEISLTRDHTPISHGGMATPIYRC